MPRGTVAGRWQPYPAFIVGQTPIGIITPCLLSAGSMHTGTVIPRWQLSAHPPWGDASPGVTHPPAQPPGFTPCPI